MIVLHGETIIILIKPNIMGSVDNKSLVYIPVDNNSCSSWISHEITAIWSIINIISCNTSINDVYYHTPYFYIFIWGSCSMPEEARNIYTQYIIISAGDTYGILISKAPKFFLVNWVQYNIYCDISKCLICYFNFTI